MLDRKESHREKRDLLMFANSLQRLAGARRLKIFLKDSIFAHGSRSSKSTCEAKRPV